MEKMCRIVVLFAILILLSLVLSGCWNRREPENMAFVIGTAFDIDEETGDFIVYLQIAIPWEMAGEEGAGGQGAFWVVTDRGETPFKAIANAATKSTREIFMAQNQIVIFSERLARKGVMPVLDYFERARQSRITIGAAVASGDIEKLITKQSPLGEIAGEAMERQILIIAMEQANVPDKRLVDMIVTLSAPGQDMLLTRVEEGGLGIVSDEDNERDEGNEGSPLAKVGGGAAFSGDKMMGWITKHDTMGWAWLLEGAFRSIVVVECPGSENGKITIDLFRPETQFAPYISGDQIGVDIILQITGRIEDQMCDVGFEYKDDYLAELDKNLSRVIEQIITNSVKRSKELRTDYMGFGNLFYRKMPHIWQTLEDEWYHKHLPGLKVSVNVQAKVERGGLVTSPIKPR